MPLMVEPSHIPLRLSLDEAVVLLIGVRLLAEMVESIEINGEPHGHLVSGLLSKLGQVIPDDLRQMTGEIVEDILVSQIDSPDETQAQDDEREYPSPMYSIETTLPVLVEAIEKRITVDVTYYSMANEAIDHYRIDPYGIKQVGDLYWLVAYVHGKDERSVYRIDRIKELCQTGSLFDRPSGFKMDEFFADDPKQDW